MTGQRVQEPSMEEMVDTTNTRQIGKIWKYVKDDLVPSINGALEPLQGDHEQVQVNTEAIGSLTEDVGTLEGTVEDHGDSIAGLKNSTQDIRTRITTMQGQISSLQNTVGEQEDDISDIHATDVLQEQKITALEGEVVTEATVSAGVGAGKIQFSVKKEDGSVIISNNYDTKEAVGYTMGVAEGPAIYAEITRSDGTTLRSNDVLLEGMVAEDTYFSSFTFKNGSAEGYISAEIGLSNGTTIQANDFALPVSEGVEDAVTELQEQMTEVLGKISNIEGTSVVATKPTENTLVNVAGAQQTGSPVNVVGSVVLDRVKTPLGSGGTVFTEPNKIKAVVNGVSSEGVDVVESVTLMKQTNQLRGLVNGIMSGAVSIVDSVSGSYDEATQKLHIEVNGVGADINFPEIEADNAIEITVATPVNFSTNPTAPHGSYSAITYHDSITGIAMKEEDDVTMPASDNVKVKFSKYLAIRSHTKSTTCYISRYNAESSQNALMRMKFHTLPNGKYSVGFMVIGGEKRTAPGVPSLSSAGWVFDYVASIEVNNGTVTSSANIPVSYNFDLAKYTDPYISYITKYE